jgi:hypothetical protein
MPDEQPAQPLTHVRRAPEPLVAALRDPAVQRLYANGFTIGLSNADAHIVLQMFGRPIAVWNLSYTLAKTLGQKLNQLVSEWEQQTGQEIVTTDKVDLAFKKIEDKQ